MQVVRMFIHVYQRSLDHVQRIRSVKCFFPSTQHGCIRKVLTCVRVCDCNQLVPLYTSRWYHPDAYGWGSIVSPASCHRYHRAQITTGGTHCAGLGLSAHLRVFPCVFQIPSTQKVDLYGGVFLAWIGLSDTHVLCVSPLNAIVFFVPVLCKVLCALLVDEWVFVFVGDQGVCESTCD